LSNDIGQPVVNDNFDFDVRIFPQQLCKFRQQDRVGSKFSGGNPNRTGRLLTKFTYGRKLSVDLVEAGARPLPLARRCAWCESAGEIQGGLRVLGWCG
jgi:hypothetical protein